VALYADRWLWVTIDDREDEAHSGQEILWVAGEVRVRQTVSSNGFHRFGTGDAEELLAVVLAGDADQAPPPVGGDPGEILAGARRVARVECGRRSGDRIEGAELTLVESAAGALWILASDDGGSDVLKPVSAAGAREQLAALAAGTG